MRRSHIAYVTINRPEMRNALHSYAYAELRSCWRDIGLDPNIYVGIVTGSGNAFCAGRDVKLLRNTSRRQADAARRSQQPDISLGRRRPAAGRRNRKAADRALNGFAVGVGLPHRAAMPAARHGGRRVDRRPAHQCWPSRRPARNLPGIAAHRRRLSHDSATAASPRRNACNRPSSTRSYRRANCSPPPKSLPK